MSNSDLAVLASIVQSHPTLNILELKMHNIDCHSTILAQLVKAAENLTELIIHGHGHLFLQIHTDMNFKTLTISSALVESIAALLPNITSLTCLEISGFVSDSDLPVLANIVQSHSTLEVLLLHKIIGSSTELTQQLVVSASKLKKLTISEHDITELLPCNIKNIKKLTIPNAVFGRLAILLH